MMHKDIEVYVDDMIAKSRTEKEHIEVLRRLSGKLLGFVVSEKGIEVDSDKVKAIRELPLPRTQKEVRGFLGRLNYIARFISQLTDKCDPIFRLLRKYNQGTWDEECHNVFEKVKQYLLNAPHDESGKKEKAIYYLSKKFTDYEMRYPPIEKLCCALIWTTRRLRQYMLYHTTWLISKLDLLKYMMESTALNGRMNSPWKLKFDGASNAVGNRIGAVLVSPNGDHYPFKCKLDFDCTNNMAEYEACIMRLQAAIERGIKTLEVYRDSALVVYQLRGEWETRDPKLISYQKVVLGLLKEFDDVNFNYLPRDENQMADALATLASMIKVNKEEEMKTIQISVYEAPAHCCNIEEEGNYNNPCYQDILRYVRDHGDILYKRRKDQVLLRCVDVVEAELILEEVHEGVCRTYANWFTMARQIMRFGYYWATMEGYCINYTKK
ncbi:hypothetical protein CXB51_004143 [Gossypium anomalum]|uniref:RNase H type-1 domain-containing protein n=1 Tax=Gossypium anomalum TaxID=47600 RepID=A0A8J6D9J0_9ROSI|nr:hypothetical protein CXB51_004143 [Gossypium anomalum]